MYFCTRGWAVAGRIIISLHVFVSPLVCDHHFFRAWRARHMHPVTSFLPHTSIGILRTCALSARARQTYSLILLSAACLCRPRRSEADCACLLPSLLHNDIAVRMIPPRSTTLSRMGCAVPFWRFLPLNFVV